jgi:ABC-type uncharacterized transport system auxiliary subunit
VAGTVRIVTWLGTSLALAACMGGSAPPDRHYRLEAPDPPELESPVFPGTLAVERLRGDGLVDQRPLVYRTGETSSELRQHGYSLWVDAPTAMLQREIADWLRRAGAAERVATAELLAGADFVLTGRLVRLERVLGDGASVDLELELAVARGRHGALVLHGVYRAGRRAASRDVEASVDALESALGEVLQRFLDDAAVALPPR